MPRRRPNGDEAIAAKDLGDRPGQPLRARRRQHRPLGRGPGPVQERALRPLRGQGDPSGRDPERGPGDYPRNWVGGGSPHSKPADAMQPGTPIPLTRARDTPPPNFAGNHALRPGPSRRTDSMARTTAAAASGWPRYSSIIAPDQTWPMGLAMRLP